jgi:RsiW-degrading membrane proteinase PrsW (M82 family)
VLAASTPPHTTDLLVTGAVLSAAVLHAVWNALAHSVKDQLVGFVLIGVAYTTCSALVAPFVAVPAAASWPC